MSLNVIGANANKLNSGLLCEIFECDENGNFIGNVLVKAFISEPLNLNINQNWASPFENTGAESKAPALTALLQSGQAQAMVAAIDALVPETLKQAIPSPLKKIIDNGQKGLDDALETLKGRTSMTKVNSRQIYASMPPVKMNLPLYFRAWSEPITEVELAISQIIEWSLSRKIADKSVLQGIVESKDISLEGLFPSLIPSFIGIRYANRSYAPFIINSVDEPLNVQRDKSLNRIYCDLNVSIESLTALDRDDFKRFREDYIAEQFLKFQ